MKYLILLLLLLPQAPDPAHPWPNHGEPTPGWTCHPAHNATEIARDAHACDCKGMILEPICPETPEEAYERHMSARCKAFCWETGHCLCEKQCTIDSN